MMRWLAVVSFSLAFSSLAFSSLATAEGITIGDNGGSEVTVTIENAPVDAVLKALQERYDFELDGLSNLGSGETLNATLSGRVPDLVTRLLRNWNHVIVKSDDAPGEISKVVIINANYGNTASKTKDEKAAAQQIENAKKAAGEF